MEESHFVCDTKALVQKAREINDKALDFLNANDWDGLVQLLTISEDIWSGTAASMYHDIVSSVDKDRNDRARSVVNRIPSFIEHEVRRVQVMDKDRNQKIKERFPEVF